MKKQLLFMGLSLVCMGGLGWGLAYALIGGMDYSSMTAVPTYQIVDSLGSKHSPKGTGQKVDIDININGEQTKAEFLEDKGGQLILRKDLASGPKNIIGQPLVNKLKRDNYFSEQIDSVCGCLGPAVNLDNLLSRKSDMPALNNFFVNYAGQSLLNKLDNNSFLSAPYLMSVGCCGPIDLSPRMKFSMALLGQLNQKKEKEDFRKKITVSPRKNFSINLVFFTCCPEKIERIDFEKINAKDKATLTEKKFKNILTVNRQLSTVN